jgi:hypothetical protein
MAKIPSITLKPCDSSQIHAHGFDPATGTLALQFKRKGPDGERVGGSVYHYTGCTPEFYKEFCGAESLGKFFGERIKPNADKFPFEKQADE